MTAPDDSTVHASAVVVGDCAVLIRGPSGAGKSRLAFDLILAGRTGQIPATQLVADDRLYLRAEQNRLAVRSPRELAGLIEIRGLGIRKCDFAAEAMVGLVVDLCADDAERLPAPEALQTIILGVKLPRIPVGRDFGALSLVIAGLTTCETSGAFQPLNDCSKGIGNHISPTLATE